jgi:hypothetical protein
VNIAGCAVVISHDRFFLDRIATHILAFEGESHVESFEGNFADYEADLDRAASATRPANRSGRGPSSSSGEARNPRYDAHGRARVAAQLCAIDRCFPVTLDRARIDYHLSCQACTPGNKRRSAFQGVI